MVSDNKEIVLSIIKFTTSCAHDIVETTFSIFDGESGAFSSFHRDGQACALIWHRKEVGYPMTMNQDIAVGSETRHLFSCEKSVRANF